MSDDATPAAATVEPQSTDGDAPPPAVQEPDQPAQPADPEPDPAPEPAEEPFLRTLAESEVERLQSHPFWAYTKAWVRREIDLARDGHSAATRAELNP